MIGYYFFFSRYEFRQSKQNSFLFSCFFREIAKKIRRTAIFSKEQQQHAAEAGNDSVNLHSLGKRVAPLCKKAGHEPAKLIAKESDAEEDEGRDAGQQAIKQHEHAQRQAAMLAASEDASTALLLLFLLIRQTI